MGSLRDLRRWRELRRAPPPATGVWLLVALGLAGCGQPAPSASRVEPPALPASAPATATPTVPTPEPSSHSAAPTPHVGEIAVLEVVEEPSSVEGVHLVAVRLQGAVGSSAIFRSVEIRARTEPIAGSTCTLPPMATVIGPTHADAVQPPLTDQTRVATVRSLGSPSLTAADGSAARFRYGPVPSLNGDFEGWVTFHVSAEAATSADYCAFDFSGVVTIVAGETTTSALPTVRIDTRITGP